jgi:hypothetical protein
VFCLDKSCFKWSQHPYVRMFLQLTGFIYYIIFLINKFLFQLFFLYLFFYIYFYAVKDVLINPSKKEGLRVDKLTTVFNTDITVGTTIEPTVPDGISKMFVFFSIFLLWVSIFFFFLEFFFAFFLLSVFIFQIYF